MLGCTLDSSSLALDDWLCHHLVPVLLLRHELYADYLKKVKTLDLVLLVHGCTLSYLALNLN